MCKLSFEEMMASHLPSKLIFLYEIPENYMEATILSNVSLGDSLSKLKIAIFAEKGSLPHFHIFKDRKRREKVRKGKHTKNNNTFHTCVSLTENRYFKHPGKTDSFNGPQMEALDALLASPYKNTDISLYCKLCKEWNVAISSWNSSFIPYISNKQMKNKPNYSYLLEAKDEEEIEEEKKKYMQVQKQ